MIPQEIGYTSFETIIMLFPYALLTGLIFGLIELVKHFRNRKLNNESDISKI